MDEATNWPNAVLDLHNADNRDYVFQCKYNATMPTLRSQFPLNISDTVQNLTVLGFFRIYVMNQLTHTESIATTIDIQVDVRAGEDFVCETPRAPNPRVFSNQHINNILYPGLPASPYRGYKVESTDPSVTFPPLYPEPTPPNFDNEAHGIESIPDLIRSLEDLDHLLATHRESVISSLAEISRIKEQATIEAKFYPSPSEYSSKLRNVSNLMTNLESLRSKIEVSFLNVAGFTGTAIQLLENLPPPPEDNEPHALEDPTAGSSETVPLQQGAASAALPHSHLATSVTSDVRDVIRRYGYWMEVFCKPNFDSRGTTIFLPVSPLALADPKTNLLAWFSMIYRGWSGSLRYKILFMNAQVDSHLVNVTHYPDIYTDTDEVIESAVTYYPGGYACKIINTTDSHSLEFEVPYKANLHFLLTRRTFDASAFHRFGYNGSVAISLNEYWKAATPDRRMPLCYQIYIAAGDDFNFHFPIPPPVSSWSNSYSEIAVTVPYTTTAISSVNTVTYSTSQARGFTSTSVSSSNTFVSTPSVLKARSSPPKEPTRLADDFEVLRIQ